MEIYHTLRPTGINTRDTLYSGWPYADELWFCPSPDFFEYTT